MADPGRLACCTATAKRHARKLGWHVSHAAPLHMQAVVRLPFPDVAAISAFVSRQLASEDCHLSAAELARNASTPGLLLCRTSHPLAPQVRARASAAVDSAVTAENGTHSAPGSDNGLLVDGDTAEAEGGAESRVEGSAGTKSSTAESVGRHAAASILPLLLPPPSSLSADAAAAVAGGSALPEPAAAVDGVVVAALDIAGQHTPPFASGLLPGAVLGGLKGRRSASLVGQQGFSQFDRRLHCMAQGMLAAERRQVTLPSTDQANLYRAASIPWLSTFLASCGDEAQLLPQAAHSNQHAFTPTYLPTT